MIITIGGRQYTAKADFAAIMDAEQSEGIRLEKFGQNGTTEFLIWLYYFVKRGEKVEGRELELSREDFCGTIGMGEIEDLARAMETLMHLGAKEENAKAGTGKKKG